VSDRGDAVEMVVTGPWTREAADAAASGQVDRLVLNHALGFDSPTLEFLEGQPIRELVVLDPRLTSLEPVLTLAETLESLKITTNPRLTVDLCRLPKLRELGAAWPQVKQTIDTASGLRVAFLRGYEGGDLGPFTSLRLLTALTFKDRPRLRSLNGVSALPELQLLGVYLAKDLDDIADVAGSRALEDLALESCRKVTRVDALAACSGLRRLNLSECGDIQSLAPLAALTELEDLRLFGSTKVLDDDLSPIAGLPRLKSLRMQSRRSYRPSVADVQATLPRG
jgi:Leucine-rich repeat (LRR) protein